jgi:hypothetical protein
MPPLLLPLLFQQIATSKYLLHLLYSMLSFVTNAHPTRVESDCDANSVVLTWCERNQIFNTPVVRVSTDAGQTFGPVINLGTNGTISTTIANTTTAE